MKIIRFNLTSFYFIKNNLELLNLHKLVNLYDKQIKNFTLFPTRRMLETVAIGKFVYIPWEIFGISHRLYT